MYNPQTIDRQTLDTEYQLAAAIVRANQARIKTGMLHNFDGPEALVWGALIGAERQQTIGSKLWFIAKFNEWAGPSHA